MERMMWEAWEAEETQGMEARAVEKARRLIATHEPEPLDDDQVREIDAIVRAAERQIVG
jgi:trimethylamine:corrinoid methyltransferase-like protein